jgi:hypothetical protein
MAYKSRITNKYLGASFAGAPTVGRSSELQQVVNTLATSFTPAMQKYGQAYIQNVETTATTKMNELYAAGKSEEDIRNEIMAGVHPELTNFYAEEAVNTQYGKFAAASAITKIEGEMENYNPFGTYNENGELTREPQTLEEFYQDFLPDFSNASKGYTAGFASTFNEYKAKALVADAKMRGEYYQNKKMEQGTSFIVNEMLVNGSEDLIEKIRNFSVELPHVEGKRTYLFEAAEQNQLIINAANTMIKTATTEEDVDKALELLTLDRGKGKGGNPLGSLIGSSNLEAIKLFKEGMQRRESLFRNNEFKKNKERDESIINLFREGMTDVTKADEIRNKIIEIHPQSVAVFDRLMDNQKNAVFDSEKYENIELAARTGAYGSVEELMKAVKDNDLPVNVVMDKLVTAYEKGVELRDKGDTPVFESNTMYKRGITNTINMVKASYGALDSLGRRYYKAESTSQMINAQRFIEKSILDFEDDFQANNGRQPNNIERDGFMSQLEPIVSKLYNMDETDLDITDRESNVIASEESLRGKPIKEVMEQIEGQRTANELEAQLERINNPELAAARETAKVMTDNIKKFITEAKDLPDPEGFGFMGMFDDRDTSGFDYTDTERSDAFENVIKTAFNLNYFTDIEPVITEIDNNQQLYNADLQKLASALGFKDMEDAMAVQQFLDEIVKQVNQYKEEGKK